MIDRPECRFEGCTNVSVRCCKGWCSKHHTRWYRHGDPGIVREPRRHLKDVMETLRARSVRDANGCWLWLGAQLPNGYGVFGIKGHSRYVHRAAWEYVNGKLSDGRQLHHTCRQRSCCNPDHLIPVTPLEHSAAHRALVGDAA